MSWEKLWGGTDYDTAWTGISMGGEGNSAMLYDNNHYIVGYSKSYGSGDRDWVILKYDLNGNLLWQKVLGTSNDDRAISVYVYGDYIYVVGFYTPSSDKDGVLLKIRRSDGTLISAKKWGCSGSDEELGGIYIKDDYVYISGYTTSGCTGIDKWQDINGTYQSVSGTTNSISDSFSDISGNVNSPSGNVSSPTPTTTGNAGGKDIVIMKIHINDIDNL